MRTLDDDRMMRWSHTGSSSLMMCEDKKTVVPSFGHRPQQGFEQLAAGQGVETGHGLVQQEEVRALSHAQRQRHQSLLAERQPPDPFRQWHLELVAAT